MALQASSKVKGITIEIGADTTSFGYAMKQIKQEASLVAKDMRTVDDAMKLNPNNIEKAADKLKLLREAADNTTKKVETIKKAIEQLNKEYSDKSSEEYKKQLDYLTRSLESATREQEVANARLKDFQTNASGAKVEVMNLGQMIEAHLTANAVSTFMNIASQAISSVISKIKELSKELVNFSKEAVLSAAEYKDQIGYSETVFNDSSEAALQWSKDNSVALRISEKNLTKYMNTLGQLLHTQGIDEGESLNMVENLMSLAADIRAATGKSTDEILPIMERGFTTSVRNFRQFGVVMTEGQVKAYALANGLGEVSGNTEELARVTAELEDAQARADIAMALHTEDSEEFAKAEQALIEAEEAYNAVLGESEVTLTNAGMITARYELLMKSLKNIIGQNEKEQKLFNSQWEMTKVIFENLKNTIGLELLPVFTDLLTKFNEFLQSDAGQAILRKIVEQFTKWKDTIAEMMEDGRLETFLNDLVDELPKIAEDIGNLVTKLLELIPKVADLADQFLQGKNQVEEFRAKVREVLDLFNLSEWDMLKYIVNPTGILSGGTGLVGKSLGSGLGKLIFGRSQGGPASAGQLLRVNDDAGHRTEMFIPSVPGTILNGNQTDKIINNTNNSRTVGDVNIYLTATSANASEIADEIGAEVQKRLRMSGAYLY
jgi:hypothetical protein